LMRVCAIRTRYTRRSEPETHMPRKRRASLQDELLRRTVEITGVESRMSIRVVTERGAEPYAESGPWVDLRGILSEPIRGRWDTLISIFPEEEVRIGPARPAAIGSIIQLRLHVGVVASFPHRDFDRLWVMAQTGHLKYADLVFTRPHYNRARVVNLSFSNEMED
jgi:hypothetical protein